VTDIAWIDAGLTAARPQALGALLRYFRDLETAEEAFQDACLRALKNWPRNGHPPDPAAWLIPRRPKRGDRRRATAGTYLCRKMALTALLHAYTTQEKLRTTAEAAVAAALELLPDEEDTRDAAVEYAGLNLPEVSTGAVVAENEIELGYWDDAEKASRRTRSAIPPTRSASPRA